MTNTKVHRKLRVLAVCALVTIMGVGLAGCGNHVRADTTTTAVTTSECSAEDDGHHTAHFLTCVITMPDTRRVTCVLAYNGRMSCDWIHADGSDYMGVTE